MKPNEVKIDDIYKLNFRDEKDPINFKLLEEIANRLNKYYEKKEESIKHDHCIDSHRLNYGE